MVAELALTSPQPIMARDDLKTLMEQALRYVKSGLLPNAIKTPEQALIIMSQGRELGIPPTVALRQITVVNGKPTCSAELMLGLVHRTYGQAAMRVFRTDNESCTVQYRQAGWDGVSEYTFTMDDAKRAGLLKNPVWTQYPAAMLRARAISATIRFAFPECINGLYTTEELGGDVVVTDEGEVMPTAAFEVVDVPSGQIVANDQTTLRDRMAARRVVAEDGTVLKDNEQPQILDDPLTCQGCRNEIKGARFRDGTILEPGDVANRSTERFGKALCMACSKIAAARQEAGAEAQ